MRWDFLERGPQSGGGFRGVDRQSPDPDQHIQFRYFAFLLEIKRIKIRWVLLNVRLNLIKKY